MSTEAFVKFMNIALMKAYCTPINKTSLMIYGAYFDMDRSSCIVRQSHVCTWYESSSLNCRRWSKLENLTVKVAFPESIKESLLDFDPTLKVIDTKMTL